MFALGLPRSSRTSYIPSNIASTYRQRNNAFYGQMPKHSFYIVHQNQSIPANFPTNRNVDAARDNFSFTLCALWCCHEYCSIMTENCHRWRIYCYCYWSCCSRLHRRRHRLVVAAAAHTTRAVNAKFLFNSANFDGFIQNAIMILAMLIKS